MISEEKFKRAMAKRKAAQERYVAKAIARLPQKLEEQRRKRENREKAKPEYIKRQLLNQVEYSSRHGSRINVFRYYPNNTDAHEDMKFQVFKYYRKLGMDVLVEPTFTEGRGRADILVLEKELIVEILGSETEKMLAEKTPKYPGCFEIIHIDANKPFNEKDLMWGIEWVM